MVVIVAEKNPHEREEFRASLAAPDLEVLTASDGAECIALCRQHLPEVVVATSSLGQMGGFAVSRELKTLAGQGAIPEPQVIVLLERQHDGWLAAWSKCDAWVTKPVDPGDLDRLVRSVAPAPSST